MRKCVSTFGARRCLLEMDDQKILFQNRRSFLIKKLFEENFRNSYCTWKFLNSYLYLMLRTSNFLRYLLKLNDKFECFSSVVNSWVSRSRRRAWASCARTRHHLQSRAIRRARISNKQWARNSQSANPFHNIQVQFSFFPFCNSCYFTYLSFSISTGKIYMPFRVYVIWETIYRTCRFIYPENLFRKLLIK